MSPSYHDGLPDVWESLRCRRTGLLRTAALSSDRRYRASHARLSLRGSSLNASGDTHDKYMTIVA